MSETRWKEITERYRRDIESGKLGPGDRIPTDAALAALHGISRATAHKALHELQRLGLVIRQRRSGTVVAPREKSSTGRIALVLDQVALHRDFPRSDLIGGLHEGLGEGYSLLWCDSKLSVDREIDFLQRMAREADGIVCWPTGDRKTSAVLNDLSARGIPLVLLDRVPEGVRANAVTSDSVGATRQALEFLMERGHKRIALFSFDKPHVSTVVERVESYEKVFAEHSLSTAGLVRLLSPDLEFTNVGRFVQSVYDALFTLRHGPEPITAVFCVQDMFAAAILDCAQSMGLCIPEDLEVASYNDWPSMMVQRPWHIHRITTEASQVGQAAAELLRSLIEGGPADPPCVKRIGARFIPAETGLLPIAQL